MVSGLWTGGYLFVRCPCSTQSIQFRCSLLCYVPPPCSLRSSRSCHRLSSPPATVMESGSSLLGMPQLWRPRRLRSVVWTSWGQVGLPFLSGWSGGEGGRKLRRPLSDALSGKNGIGGGLKGGRGSGFEFGELGCCDDRHSANVTAHPTPPHPTLYPQAPFRGQRAGAEQISAVQHTAD